MRYSQETIKCDGCGSPVKEPSFIINNGSHQSVFKTIEDKDICNNCLGKMFDLYIRDHKIPNDEVLEYLPKIKALNDRPNIRLYENQGLESQELSRYNQNSGYNEFNKYKFPSMGGGI